VADSVSLNNQPNGERKREQNKGSINLLPSNLVLTMIDSSIVHPTS